MCWSLSKQLFLIGRSHLVNSSHSLTYFTTWSPEARLTSTVISIGIWATGPIIHTRIRKTCRFWNNEEILMRFIQNRNKKMPLVFCCNIDGCEVTLPDLFENPSQGVVSNRIAVLSIKWTMYKWLIWLEDNYDEVREDPFTHLVYSTCLTTQFCKLGTA